MKKITPYITEKSVQLVKSNKFTLLVDYDATKKEIESLIKKYYHFKPVELRVLKTKYLQGSKYRKSYLNRGIKKIIVELKEGQRIPGFEYEDKSGEKGKKQTGQKSSRQDNGKKD